MVIAKEKKIRQLYLNAFKFFSGLGFFSWTFVGYDLVLCEQRTPIGHGGQR